MTTANEIPGYVQGHRFSQDPAFYNSGSERFLDLAGYGSLNECEKTAGTPAFSTHGANSREGLLLDNSCQWRFLPAIPWEGTIMVVLKPTLVSASVTHRPWLFGKVATATSNGNITLLRASGNNVLQCNTAGVALQRAISGLTGGAIMIAVFELNQQTRKIRSTTDGVTVTETSAAAGAVNGNAVAIGHASTADWESRYCRMGNLDNSSTTPNATDYLHVFEQHFWKGRALTDNLPEMSSFINTLKTYYGI